jgi:hypothetical protein
LTAGPSHCLRGTGACTGRGDTTDFATVKIGQSEQKAGTVFVLDDDAAVRELFPLLLETSGYKVATYDSEMGYFESLPP